LVGAAACSQLATSGTQPPAPALSNQLVVIIRDPLWNNIRVDALALRLVDTPVFQRLRYVRQLGLAYLVYPGATHTRFEHALGTYHLARLAMALLDERGELSGVPLEERAITQAAALLHDVGHYPFSHALEEIGALHHEEVATPLVSSGPVADALSAMLGSDAPARALALIRGTSDSPLQGLVSGSLDLDKIEYLKRDALMCGVPYGEIDVDRLLNSLVLVEEPATGCRVMGVLEKGLSALESLLFAKYQMYRNVYWHHAVRSATAMYKRLVDEALTAGDVDALQLSTFDDEGLLHRLAERGASPLLSALRERRLYKRILECPAAELSGVAPEWIADDRARTIEMEDRIAEQLGLAPGELLLDFPVKTQMLGLDLPVVRRSGEVRRLTTAGLEGAINLPMLSEQLYQSARWLRVFAIRRVEVPRGDLLEQLLRAA
jgi:HD superfamily phosphohydrolase